MEKFLLGAINEFKGAKLGSYTSIEISEVPKLIEELKEFLGKKQLNKALEKYNKTLQFSKSTPFYREYYLKIRHPWWHALVLFERPRFGDSFSLRLMNEEIASLAYDAKKLLTLAPAMSKTICEKYRSALLDENSARNYLFELDVAWLFYKKNWKIEWRESSNQRTPEFDAQRGNKKLQVECKSINRDTAIRIKRDDFYKLVDFIFAKIRHRKLMGRIEIVFHDDVSINDDYLRKVASRIDKKLNVSHKHREEFSDFEVDFDLHPLGNVIVIPSEIWNDFYRRKSVDWHGTILFSNYQGSPVDPLEISLKSKGTGKLLTTIHDVLNDASQSQMSTDNAGFLACRLSEIPSFSNLEKGSGLSHMVEYLFQKEKMKHIVAIAFLSDEDIQNRYWGKLSQSPALIFENQNCKFKNFIDRDFII